MIMNFSKAHDCLSHELLIAKLAAYGFSKQSMRFIYSFLKGRKQGVCLEKTWAVAWKLKVSLKILP